MNRKPFLVWGFALALALMPAASAAARAVPRSESAAQPEMLRLRDVLSPIGASISPVIAKPLQERAFMMMAQPMQQQAAQSLGPNLISNPSFETLDANGEPAGWHKGGYGSSTREWYQQPPGNAHTGSMAEGVTIAGYHSGDAKWYFDPVRVTGGSTYQFSDWYESDIASEIDVQVTHTDGSITYIVLGESGPTAGAYEQFSAQFTVPADAASLTVFHLIGANGSLSTDDYSLAEVMPPAGDSLVPNGGFEIVGPDGQPLGWHKGGYGTNVRQLTYKSKSAHGGSGAVTVDITQYTSGDAKWYFDPVPIEGGQQYAFSDWYESTVPSEVDAQITHADGSISYIVLGTPGASRTYAQFAATFITPADAAKITIFHVIDGQGELTVDDYVLTSSEPAGGGSGGNYIPNGNLDAVGDGVPQGWIEGGYGKSTRTFTYPVPGVSGNAASLTVTGYASGDAKWAAPYVSVPAGAYRYEDDYKADVPSLLTADFEFADGTDQYVDLAALPAESSWTHANLPFTVPADAVGVRIFHLLDRNGTLTIDNASITAQPGNDTGIFRTGAVSFRFDDGSIDQYQNAAPVLKQAGFTGTFYIISRQIKDDGFSGYMSIAQIKDLYAHGFEIGAHTRTHPYLSTETYAQQQDEIAGSRQDILAWNVGPVDSFAYPYGDYDATTTRIVQDAGFESAAATIAGDVTPESDHYQLQYEEVRSGTTLAQVQAWIDTAKQSHTWLILTFHQVSDASSDPYASSPELFKKIVDAVASSGLPVVSVSEGMQSLE